MRGRLPRMEAAKLVLLTLILVVVLLIARKLNAI